MLRVSVRDTVRYTEVLRKISVEKPQFYRNSAGPTLAYAGHMLTGKCGIYVVLMAH